MLRESEYVSVFKEMLCVCVSEREKESDREGNCVQELVNV